MLLCSFVGVLGDLVGNLLGAPAENPGGAVSCFASCWLKSAPPWEGGRGLWPGPRRLFVTGQGLVPFSVAWWLSQCVLWM